MEKKTNNPRRLSLKKNLLATMHTFGLRVILLKFRNFILEHVVLAIPLVYGFTALLEKSYFCYPICL